MRAPRRHQRQTSPRRPLLAVSQSLQGTARSARSRWWADPPASAFAKTSRPIGKFDNLTGTRGNVRWIMRMVGSGDRGVLGGHE